MKNLILSIAMAIIAMPVFASQKSDTDVECLALNVYYEARAESFDGKLAVAQVTLNRVNSKKFPNSICSVVHERTRVAARVFCQFSWTCNRPRGQINTRQYQESLAAAMSVLQGETNGWITKSLFFQEKSRPVPKGRKLLGVIGNHAFLL